MQSGVFPLSFQSCGSSVQASDKGFPPFSRRNSCRSCPISGASSFERRSLAFISGQSRKGLPLKTSSVRSRVSLGTNDKCLTRTIRVSGYRRERSQLAVGHCLSSRNASNHANTRYPITIQFAVKSANLKNATKHGVSSGVA